MAVDAEALVNAVVEETTKALRDQTERIGKLDARLAELEASGLKYVGTWQAAQDYRRGHFTTLNGALWHANEDTRDKPGTSKAWTLAVKAGGKP